MSYASTSDTVAETLSVTLGDRTVEVPRGGFYDHYRMNPDLDVIAEDPMVSSVDFFRTLPKNKVNAAIGESWIPNYYYRSSSARIVFPTKRSAARKILPSELDPLEVALGDNDLHAYVLALPVNTDIAQVRDHEDYGLPKWRADIDVSIDSRRVSARVLTDSGRDDVSLSAPTPKQKRYRSREKVSSVTSYTKLGDSWHATLPQFNLLSGGAAIFSRYIELTLGSGRVSEIIRFLGYGRPVQVEIATESQAALHMPVPVSVPTPTPEDQAFGESDRPDSRRFAKAVNGALRLAKNCLGVKQL